VGNCSARPEGSSQFPVLGSQSETGEKRSGCRCDNPGHCRSERFDCRRDNPGDCRSEWSDCRRKPQRFL